MHYPIATMVKADYLPTVELAALCFGEDMRVAAMLDFSLPFYDYPVRPTAFVARDGDKMIGVIQSIPAYITPDCQAFLWLGVHPEYRRQHIGRAMLDHAEKAALAERLSGRDGTFLLVSDCDPHYYRAQGYVGSDVRTHEGSCFLVKHHRWMAG